MINNVESIYDRRRKVHDAIQAGWIDARVVALLLENGKGADDEAPLWDYKASLPITSPHKNDALSRELDAKLAEIVKDCVAFYNSHGGYILAGVDDATRQVLGFDGKFDAADLNKRIHGAVGVSIETIFRVVDVSHIKPGLSMGLLLIPKRQSGLNPAQFRKAAPASSTGKVAYAAQTFYFRERDNCRPAKSPEDYEFLYSSRSFGYSAEVGRFLDSNLPDRDPELIQLIGRQGELAALWSWLSDEFSPVKVLSGLGGLGKTSISYTFSERLIDRAPATLDRLIWLGAKSETFSGEMNRDVRTARVDFETVEQLLFQLLVESGCPEKQIPENPSQRELMELCRDHLSAHNYIIVVDNVDTLDDADQQVVFHLLTQLCSPTGTKCIITARRNLGAPKSVVIEVEGLPREDFFDFVVEKSTLFKVAAPARDSVEMRSLFEASGGSPLFALSILRLVGLGDSLRNAINHWKGSDGETVRDAAFKSEVGRLKRNQARTLLALCYRKKASSVELANLLGLTRYEVQAAIEELQSFSMTKTDNSLPGGAIFSIPETLKLVTSIVEQRVADHAEIKRLCLKSVEISRNKRPYIADAVIRAMAYLDQSQVPAALEVVDSAMKSLPEDPDLLCLRGRCLQAKGDYDRAGDAFQQAYDLGCRKRELFVGWNAVAEDHEDWKAMIEVSRLADAHVATSRSILSRNFARAQLGHERCRGGDYKGAIDFYESALGELRSAINTFHNSGDRAEFSKQRELLAVSWLGAIQQSAIQAGDDGRRVFGAYHRAIVTFRLQSPHTFMSAIGVLADWVKRVQQRQLVSATARDNLVLAKGRLSTLQEVVDANKRFSENFAAQFHSAAGQLHSEISRLVT